MDKRNRIYPEVESTFYSVYTVELRRDRELVRTLDHIKLIGETLISVATTDFYYTIVAAKP